MKVFTIIKCLFFILLNTLAFAQEKSPIDLKESAYYEIVDVPIPKGVLLEVGGLALTDDDKLGVSTRRGELWLIDKPSSQNPVFNKFATGLHEPLGLSFRNNSFYLAQRGELTRIQDNNSDGKADAFETIYSWPLSGNYHEYSYGPKFMKNGDMIVTLNLGWAEGTTKSLAKWRGWMLQITPEGEMTPIATGLRSPAGFGINDEDDIFYTENQGGWIGSGRLTHIESGDFAGHPAGLKWTDDPKSPLKLNAEDIAELSGLTLHECAEEIPEIKIPTVWFPHSVLGISTSDMLYHKEGVDFGPFENQIFIGDQGHSNIMRVYMEKVNGVYQGAAFPFKEGFSSGILRMVWGNDSSMFVGMTSRGWASKGKKSFGLQRLKWTGKTPFEINTMKAQDDGFLLEFTKAVDKKIAGDVANYKMASFTYKYHEKYGSPIEQKENAMIHAATVSDDGKSVKLLVHGMRLGFIHQLRADGVKDITGESLLHNSAYYTLNEVPGGVLNSPPMPVMCNDSEVVEQAKHITEMPFTWVNGPDKKMSIGTKPGMKFDIEELTIERDTKLELTFVNDDDMLHNLVFTKPGKDIPMKMGMEVFELGIDGAKYNYVPDSPLILCHTAIVGPESSEKIFIEIPHKRGQYWFICTIPGHSRIMNVKVNVI